MKYFKITSKTTNGIDYQQAESLEAVKQISYYSFSSQSFNFEEITKDEYDKHFTDEAIRQKADKGQLIDDIAIWHNVFSETLIKIIIFKYNTEAAMRVKLKVTSDIIAKYNLNLVIKDFNPDFTIPQEDKNKLIDGLKEVELYDNDIYNKMAQAVGLESGALHNAVIDAYESAIQALHPSTDTDPLNVGELVSGGTT